MSTVMELLRLAALYYKQPQTFAACDDLVGRAPWPAADPLVGLLKRSKIVMRYVSGS